ncbi:hypothetical protein AAFL49_08575 [Klebsiella michiganensis]|uniref:hypothetical protein n=1 Tax=Klebsiella michiganensis TaxID=1134687 RepID=UPI001560AB10|nr:hypothetical protein [Klebsiella michiganensis]NRG21805.1 hypothetical protein [Klebsiella michiganensis]
METAGDFSDVTELQKYMNFSKFMDLIETNKIFLSKASGFEDKNEGGLSLEFRFLNDGSAMMLDVAMNHIFPSVRELSPEERVEHNKKTEQLFEIIEKELIVLSLATFRITNLAMMILTNNIKNGLM